MVLFSDFVIDERELSMLQRVHNHACSFKELEPESEEGVEIGKMLFHLYRQGIRDELALVQMLTDGAHPICL
ncbi:hypothetical protein [Sinorhizobium terangae]|uniref:Uncharacterized protein n=1 Tax=Sinorhizobium terangae TaxID=110322 RepID=A0A6N7L8C5_SINTE|nr:hypothetical protein [Sinorhizobium terangae]MBB4184265.1 hypothetical protein [Sinorhizobium terangae]MQX13972.1 hypothetical protein [Sinorhizobium terangae]WFU50255.1 hypothetical protein QA637_26125 [Sinorhizobium terangae]